MNTRNWTLKLAAVLLVLVLYTSHLCSNLYARYTTSSSASDEARVAAGVVEFNLLKENQISVAQIDLENIKPGDTYVYDLSLKNYTDTSVCEVAMDYSVILETTGNLPLIYTITVVDSSQPLNLTKRGNKHSWSGGVMEATQQTQQSYTLSVEWPESENDVAYSMEVDLVVISIESKQID